MPKSPWALVGHIPAWLQTVPLGQVPYKQPRFPAAPQGCGGCAGSCGVGTLGHHVLQHWDDGPGPGTHTDPHHPTYGDTAPLLEALLDGQSWGAHTCSSEAFSTHGFK